MLLVTLSLTLIAGKSSVPAFCISYSRWTPVVVSSETPCTSFANFVQRSREDASERQSYPGHRATATNSADRPYDVAGWTLPAQMGVDVRTVDRPFVLPQTAPVDAPTIRPNRVRGEPNPSHWVIDARGTSGALAINRLAVAGAKVAWMASDVEIDGYKFAPGSLVVDGSKSLLPVVDRIAAQLGLRVAGTTRKPGFLR